MENPAARFLGGISERTGLWKDLNMHTHSKTSDQIQGLPLFDWRAAVVHKPATRAGQYLCRRFPVRPELADLVASLAGLGGSTDR